MSLFDYAQEVVSRKLERKSPVLTISMGMEPVMPMAQGGGLSTVQNSLNINGEPHRLAYINPSEESLLQQLGGSGRKIDGIPTYDIGDDGGPSGSPNDGIGDDGGPSGSPNDGSGDQAGITTDTGEEGMTTVGPSIDDGSGDPPGITTDINEEGLSTFGGPTTGGPDTFDIPKNLSFFEQVKNQARTFGRDPNDVLDLVLTPVIATKGLRGFASLVGQGLSKAGLAGPNQTANEAVAEQEASLDDVGGTGDDIIIREKIAAVKNVPVEEVTVEEVERAKRLTAAQRVAGTRLEDILDQIYGSGKGAGLLGIATNNTGTA